MASTSSTDPSAKTPSDSSKHWGRGLILVLLAIFFLSLHNNLVKIAQSPKPLSIFGWLYAGGYVAPNPLNPLQVPLLVLLVRITLLLPFLWAILPRLKPGAWVEARQVMTGNDPLLKLRVVVAGVFLFILQTLIYFSIAKVGPAIAITLFYIYPTVTTLLAWWLFGERPSWKQWLATILIYLGCILLAFNFNLGNLFTDFLKAMSSLSTANPIGLLTAVCSGVVFALEGVIAQSCFKKINPATFTAMSFTVEWLVLAVFALVLIHVSLNAGLLIIGLLLSLATLCGYLFYNFGIQEVGAAKAAIIGSSGPAVTALLGVIVLKENLNSNQWVAIAVVTVGVVLMNLAKARAKPS